MKLQRNICIYVCLLLVSAAGVAGASESDVFSEWMFKHVSKDEQILCQREVGGDYFFVAKSGALIKVGSLLNVTGETSTPKSYVISWMFRNEVGESLERSVPPKVLSRGFVRIYGELYAEQTAHRTLFLENADKLSVSIELKKYEQITDIPENKSLSDMGMEEFHLCDVAL